MDLTLLPDALRGRSIGAAPPSSSTPGWVEVIAGPMFSGKTEELIRRLRRATLARQQVMVFQPAADHRYRSDALVSHAHASLAARTVDSPAQIVAQMGAQVQVVGIDEAQFFGPPLAAVVEQLADSGRRVLVAGLDQDFSGAPFAPMPELMARAEWVTKAQAICMRCGRPAGRTQRLVACAEQVLVGGQQMYEARCRGCHGPAAAATTQPAAWAD